MAKNKITAQMRLEAEAQLKNSQKFINELNHITDNFDLGSKVMAELEDAKNKAKELNKILEKASNSFEFNDKDWKALNSVSAKLEKLQENAQKNYIHFSDTDWKKYSREYLAQVEKDEKARAKIKEEYAKKTGGRNFDKDIVAAEQLQTTLKNVQAEYDNLIKSKNSKIEEAIDAENKKLQAQFELLQKIEKTEKTIADKKNTVIQQYSANTGYSTKQLQQKPSMDEDDVKQAVANKEYHKIVDTYATLTEQKTKLIKQGHTEEQAYAELVVLAKQLGLHQINTSEEMKEQLQLLEKQKNFYRLLKNREQLVNEQNINEELKDRERLLRTIEQMTVDINKDLRETLQDNNFVSVEDMQKQKRILQRELNSTQVNLTAEGASLSESGESAIAETISNSIDVAAAKQYTQIEEITGILQNLLAANNKMATQTERAVDEQDIKQSASAINDNTQRAHNTTRTELTYEITKDNDATKTLKDEHSAMSERLKDVESAQRSARGRRGAITRKVKQAPDYQVGATFADFTKKYKPQQDMFTGGISAQFAAAQKMRSDYEEIKADIPYAASEQEKEELLTQARGLLKTIYDTITENAASAQTEVKNELNNLHKNAGKINKDLTPNKRGGWTQADVDNYFAQDAELQAMYMQMKNASAIVGTDYQEELKALQILESKPLLRQAKPARYTQNSGKTFTATKAKQPNNAPDFTDPNLSQKTAEIGQNIQNLAEQSSFLGSVWDDLKNKAAYWFSLNFIWDQMVRKIGEAVEITKSMDQDMTQIGLVLGQTSNQIWNNFDNYSKMADRLNTTTSDVTQSMKLFYQQGLRTAEVNKMVEASAIAAALGETSMAEASETLTSILNSYNLTANQAMSVTDKISQVAIVSAADFNELSIAIEKVAASASSAGLDLDHMMGYLAKMIETTREAPTNIGTALKTIVANFTQFKEDPSQINEEGSDINKVDTALKSVGISLTNAQGEVRDLGDVLDELGGKWDSLNRNQKAYLATAIAGTRQQSRFYALMNDYDRTLELVTASTDSAGKAQQQFGLYSHSLEAATKRLSNEWEKFFTSITSGNTAVKGFVNLLTELMKIANKLGPLGTIVGIIPFIKGMRGATSEISKFVASFKQLTINPKNSQTILQGFDKYKNQIDMINANEGTSNTKKAELINVVKGQASKYAKSNDLPEHTLQYYKELDTLINKNKILETAKQQFLNLGTQIKATGLSMKTLSATVKTMPQAFTLMKVAGQITFTTLKVAAKSFMVEMLPMLAITVAIEALMMAWKAVTAVIDAATTSAEEYFEAAQKATENAQGVKNLRDEYAQLSSIVNRTADEEKRLKEITEEIVDIDAKLGKQLRDNVDAFKDNVAAMDDYIKQQERIAAIQELQGLQKEIDDEWIVGNSIATTWQKFWGNDAEISTNEENARAAYSQATDAIAKKYGLDDTYTAMLQRMATEIEERYATEGNPNDTDWEWQADFDNFVNELSLIAKTYATSSEESTKNVQQLLTDTQDATLSYNELLTKINEATGVPQEIKDSYINSTNAAITNAKNTIQTNTGITDNNAQWMAENLSKETLAQFFSSNKLSNLSDSEKTEYYRQLTELFNNAEVRKGISAADELGGLEAVQYFLDYIAENGEGVGDLLLEVSGGLVSLSQKVESAKVAFEKLETIQNDAAWTGSQLSQMDIIKGVIDNTYNVHDVNTLGDSNMLTVSLRTLIAQTEAQFAKIKAPLEHRQEEAQASLDFYNPQNYGDNLVKQKELELQNAKDELANANKANDAAQKEKEEYKDAGIGKIIAGGLLSGLGLVAGGALALTGVGAGLGAAIGTAGVAAGGSIINSATSPEQQAAYLRAEETQNNVNSAQNKLANAEKELELAKRTKQIYEGSYMDLQKMAEEEVDKLGLMTDQEAKQTLINNKHQELLAQKDKMIAEVKKEQKETEVIKEGYDNTLTALEKIEEKTIGMQKKFTAVFESFSSAGQVNADLDSLSEAYQLCDQGAQGYFDVAQAIAEDPSLIDAIDMESEYLELNKEKVQELAQEKVDAQITELQAKLKGTDAILQIIDAEIEARKTQQHVDATATNDEIKNIGKAIAMDEERAKAAASVTDNEKENLEISVDNWETWQTQVVSLLNNVETQRAKIAKNMAFGTTAVGNIFKSAITAIEVKFSGKAAKEYEGDDDEITTNEERYDQLLTQITSSSDEDLKAMRERYAKQKSILEKSIKSLKSYDLKKHLKGGNETAQAFEKLLEKLDKFYNYLRQIEKLEAKLNQLRAQRELIDLNKNYYIQDLKTENELLQEQQDLYRDYIADQSTWLQELQTQLTKEFSDWVYFTEEGVIQVKQTEFNIDSEAEQERYDLFTELLGLYEEEYNTREENQTKLTELEVNQLENIKSMYDKILSRVTDITDELNRQIDLLDHDMTMSFSNIAKFDIMDEKVDNAADGLIRTLAYLQDFEKQVNNINDTVKNSQFSELFVWDETLGQWIANEEKLQDESVIKKYEDLGYTWQEIDTWVRDIVTRSQTLKTTIDETTDSSNQFAEALKTLLDDRISAIQDFYSASTEEMNKLFDKLDRKMTNADNANTLFGVASENLEAKYQTAKSAAEMLKATVISLRDNKASILQQIQDEYPEYVDIIEGVAYVNKQAIEESTTLTDGQKAKLLQLYGVMEAAEEQTGEMEDKLFEYYNTMLEMEQAKRDAIIDMQQRVHDEMIARDQEEIDNLSEKYAKMNELDSEYYSKLQQRISDARNARADQQSANNLAQMQARLGVLQRDNSGAYNAELVELQRQINEQLQAQADKSIDDEMERISREQQERQEDREMQITQMENLLTFKDENGIYWQEALAMINGGPGSVVDYLMGSKEIQNSTMEMQAQSLEEMEDVAATATAELGNIVDGKIKEAMTGIVTGVTTSAEGLKTPLGEIKDAITTATAKHLETMSALFDYLGIEVAEDKAEEQGAETNTDTGSTTAPTPNTNTNDSTTTTPSTNTTTTPTLKVGGNAKAKKNASIYTVAKGGTPYGQYYRDDPKYKILDINKKTKRAKVRYHKLSSGVTGWINLSDLTPYSKGGYVDYTGLAAVHGTQNSPEAFLNAKQTALFEQLRDLLAKPASHMRDDNTNGGDNISIESLTIDVKELADTDSIDKVVKTVKQSIYKDATNGNSMKINRRR